MIKKTTEELPWSFYLFAVIFSQEIQDKRYADAAGDHICNGLRGLNDRQT